LTLVLRRLIEEEKLQCPVLKRPLVVDFVMTAGKAKKRSKGNADSDAEDAEESESKLDESDVSDAGSVQSGGKAQRKRKDVLTDFKTLKVCLPTNS
jgi:hypothetical protein